MINHFALYDICMYFQLQMYFNGLNEMVNKLNFMIDG